MGHASASVAGPYRISSSRPRNSRSFLTDVSGTAVRYVNGACQKHTNNIGRTSSAGTLTVVSPRSQLWERCKLKL